MEILLTEEQCLLRESASKLLEASAGPKLARAVRVSDIPFDPTIWRETAAAGWLAIMVPEEMGGLGLGITELAVILEESGKALLPGPLAAVAVVAKVLSDAPNPDIHRELIESIVAGDNIVLPTLQESAFDLSAKPSATHATTAGNGWELNGQKVFIPDAGAADGFLVSAATADGPILCLIDNDAPGVVLERPRSVDGGDMGTLSLSSVAVSASDVIAGPNQAAEICQSLNDLTFIGTCAELLGIMETALDMSVEYLKVRTQFDQPIGKFQALQHRAANDYVDIELARSLLFQSCAIADRNEDVSTLASALKAQASRTALLVTKSAIQFHGAIGVSDEHDIGLYFKRAIALSSRYGNEMAHRRRYAILTGIEPAHDG